MHTEQAHGGGCSKVACRGDEPTFVGTSLKQQHVMNIYLLELSERPAHPRSHCPA